MKRMHLSTGLLILTIFALVNIGQAALDFVYFDDAANPAGWKKVRVSESLVVTKFCANNGTNVNPDPLLPNQGGVFGLTAEGKLIWIGGSAPNFTVTTLDDGPFLDLVCLWADEVTAVGVNGLVAYQYKSASQTWETRSGLQVAGSFKSITRGHNPWADGIIANTTAEDNTIYWQSLAPLSDWTSIGQQQLAGQADDDVLWSWWSGGVAAAAFASGRYVLGASLAGPYDFDIPASEGIKLHLRSCNLWWPGGTKLFAIASHNTGGASTQALEFHDMSSQPRTVTTLLDLTGESYVNVINGKAIGNTPEHVDTLFFAAGANGDLERFYLDSSETPGVWYRETIVSNGGYKWLGAATTDDTGALFASFDTAVPVELSGFSVE